MSATTIVDRYELDYLNECYGAAKMAAQILLADPDLPTISRVTVQNLADKLAVLDPTEMAR